MRIAPCGVSEMDVKMAFGMSKMTVINEGKNYQDYNKLQFVEFLEFIGRLAHGRFKNASQDLQQQPLATKIEQILDDLLYGYGLTRKEVEIAIEEFSESDDDY